MHKVKAIVALLKGNNFDTIKELLEISYITKETFVEGLNKFFLQDYRQKYPYFVPSVIDLLNILGDFDTEYDQQLIDFLISSLVIKVVKNDNVQAGYLLKLIELGAIVKNQSSFCYSNMSIDSFVYYVEKNNIIFDAGTVATAAFATIAFGSNMEICDRIFQEWMTYAVDLQSICNVAINTYKFKYFPLVMQKTYDYQNAHIVTIFIMSVNFEYEGILEHITESQYYRELILYSLIKKSQSDTTNEDTRRFFELLENNECAEKIYKKIVAFINLIQKNGINVDFDLVMQWLSELLKYQYHIDILTKIVIKYRNH
uniref:Uncharacterized protein n=1 Tax=viral metagenome TaxID=1070528 RepID=A0A6C0C9W9_9ZZZZ